MHKMHARDFATTIFSTCPRALAIATLAGCTLFAGPAARATVIGPTVAVDVQKVYTTNSGVSWTVVPPSYLNGPDIYRSTDGSDDYRGVIEFPALPIAGPVHVNSVTFRFSIPIMSESTKNAITINFYGYGDADGVTTVADAIKTSKLVASLPNVNQYGAGTGIQNISLDASFVESVVNSNGRVGLVAATAVGDSNACVPSILTIYETNPVLKDGFPALTVDYSPVPEPSTLALALIGFVGLIAGTSPALRKRLCRCIRP